MASATNSTDHPSTKTNTNCTLQVKHKTSGCSFVFSNLTDFIYMKSTICIARFDYMCYICKLDYRGAISRSQPLTAYRTKGLLKINTS